MVVDLVSCDGKVVGDAKWYRDLTPILVAQLSGYCSHGWRNRSTPAGTGKSTADGAAVFIQPGGHTPIAKWSVILQSFCVAPHRASERVRSMSFRTRFSEGGLPIGTS